MIIDRLRQRWQIVLPGRHTLFDEVIRRWSEPHRHYHELRHLEECLTAIDGLGGRRPETLAAWFHDIVYDGVPGHDEQRSAELAGDRLRAAGEDDALTSEVERLVLMTIEHRPDPSDAAACRLSDADLAILGAPPERYDVSVRDIRREYARFDDDQWRRGRTSVLQTFLGQDQIFHTDAGGSRWEESARSNLRRELAALTGGRE